MSGTGKTTLAASQFQKEKAAWKFIYDHKGGEFGNRFRIPSVYDWNGIVEATARGGYVCFNPVYLYPGEFQKGFLTFCDYVWSMVTSFRGRKLFLVDELQNLTDNRNAPKEFMTFLDTGRSFKLDTFSLASAPNALHNRLRNQFTEVFAFRQTDDNATKFLKAKGIEPITVRNLPNGRYAWRQCDTGESGIKGKAF